MAIPACSTLGVILLDKFAEAEGQRLLSSLLGAESQLLLILMALVCREA